MSKEIFRVALFGGYNKEDVQEYIKTLENEIEAIKVLHQKEKNDLLRQMDSEREEQIAGSEELPRLQRELDRKNEKLLELQMKFQNKSEEFRTLEAALNEKETELIQVKEALAVRGKSTAYEADPAVVSEMQEKLKLLQEEYDAMKKEKEALLTENAKMSQKLDTIVVDDRPLQEKYDKLVADKDFVQKKCEALLHEAAEYRKKYEAAVLENEKLQRSFEEANIKLDQQEALVQQMQREQEQAFIDHKTISKVLEDANRNAELIEKDAQKRCEEMIEGAKKKVEEERIEVINRVNSELEDKGIQLIAAKHKIDQYMKEVKQVQEGLYHIYTRMNTMIGNMPVRLDDYWNGEHYKMLEEKQRENNEQKDTMENS